MMKNSNTKVIVLYEDSYLADLLERADRLHTAVAEGKLPTLTTLSQREVVEWLRDVIYTAEETILEINRRADQRDVRLRLVERPGLTDYRSS